MAELDKYDLNEIRRNEIRAHLKKKGIDPRESHDITLWFVEILTIANRAEALKDKKWIKFELKRAITQFNTACNLAVGIAQRYLGTKISDLTPLSQAELEDRANNMIIPDMTYEQNVQERLGAFFGELHDTVVFIRPENEEELLELVRNYIDYQPKPGVKHPMVMSKDEKKRFKDLKEFYADFPASVSNRSSSAKVLDRLANNPSDSGKAGS